MKNADQKERKIHMVLSEDVHQRLRVKCALRDVAIQEYVSRLIKEDIKNIDLTSPKTKGRGGEMMILFE